MAPNGTSRKTPTAAKPIKMEDAPSLEHLFDDMEGEGKPEVKEEVKKSLPAVRKPGHWDSEVVAKDSSKNTSTRSSPQPPAPMTKINSSIAKAFPTGQPMKDKPETLKCNHCKRAVSKHAMPKHIEGCLNKKQEKQRKKKEAKDARDAAARKEKNGTAADSDASDDDAGTKTLSSKTGSKKRKAGDNDTEDAPASGPAKKKKKTAADAKAKAPKAKAPVDVEKQCGVELPQGGQCARSLTCKSHSMGAKRAVPGRSAKYDKLLMEYQRKNQAKLQKAQFDAAAPNPEDEALPTGPVDSEEERDAVMASIARCWGGRPLHQATLVPLRSKYAHNRIKGMLQSALGARGGGLFGNAPGAGAFFGAAGAGATIASASGSAVAAPVVDEQGFVHARRGSVVPGARSMMAPAGSRKGSLAA